MPVLIAAHLVYSLATLYMICVLLRWLGPWAGIDLTEGRFRWVCWLTDPVVGRVRKILPPVGPWDAGPIATLLLVWLARGLIIYAILGSLGSPLA